MAQTACGCLPNRYEFTALNKLSLRSKTYFQRKRAKRSEAWRELPAGAYPTAMNLRLLINCLCGRKPIFNANERNEVKHGANCPQVLTCRSFQILLHPAHKRYVRSMHR